MHPMESYRPRLHTKLIWLYHKFYTNPLSDSIPILENKSKW